METVGISSDPLDAKRSIRCSRKPKRYQTQDSSLLTQEPVNNSRILKIFAGQSGICLVIATIIIYVAVGRFLNIRYRRDHELERMKKYLEITKMEIDQAEKSCFTSATDVRCPENCSMRSIGADTAMPVAGLGDVLNLQTPSIARLADQLTVLRQLIMQQHNSSRNEVAIMSYTYTASFNTEKTNNSETTTNS